MPREGIRYLLPGTSYFFHPFDRFLCIQIISILLFMVEARGEVKTCLEGEAFGERIVGIETVDKMTDQQIAALG